MAWNEALDSAPAAQPRRAPQTRTMRTAFGTAASLLLALVLWVAFAPPSLGGHMTMLVVNGNSMEPGMHRGDVVFVSNLGRPTVGEIAAFRFSARRPRST